MCVARAELQLLALAARLGIAGAKPFKRGDAVCESLSGRSVLGAEVGKADAARSGSSMSIRKTSSSSPAKPRRFMVDCTGRWKASALGRRKSEVPVGGLARGSTAARGSAAAPRSRLSGREPIIFCQEPAWMVRFLYTEAAVLDVIGSIFIVDPRRRQPIRCDVCAPLPFLKYRLKYEV